MALKINYTRERHVGRLVFAIIFVGFLAATGWFGYKWYATGELPFFIPIVSATDVTVDESDVTATQISDHKVAANQPRYINIPLLGVGDARVYQVALDASNQIETPDNIHDASWYNKSATPGSGGVIILSGYAIGANHDGVFKKLNTLIPDDEIIVKRGDNEIFTYRVVENKNMTVDEANTLGMSIIGKPVKADKESLNIIIADGKWVPGLGTFDRRTIVRAAIADLK